jgi:hypothetical protein
VKGAHPKIVSEMLRHSSIAITLDAPGLGEAKLARWRTHWGSSFGVGDWKT